MNEPLINELRRNQENFHPLIPFNKETDHVILFDFTQNNKDLTEEIVTDTNQFIRYIQSLLETKKAKYGIGGYGENRILYKRSRVFDSVPGEEPRRLHLGVDIWGKPYTRVMSPLDGIVHSFAFNNNFGDYGATMILSHKLADLSFHTLYGHLSLNSIKNLREGMHVEKGDVIGEFGIPMENGQWPSHLHFQLIHELGDWKGDYPGVCKDSERKEYLDNCPDPDLIVQMMQYARE